MKLKTYGWALEGLAALVIFVGLIIMLTQKEDLSALVIQAVGLGILFFTIMRIKPIVSSRNEKDFVIIMVLELVLTIVVGIIMLFFSTTVEGSKIISFSRLTGVVLYTRGIVHFYTTAKRYELHDIVAFIVHVLFISFGFLFLFNALEANYVVWVIYALSFLLVAFFSYRSYNGYSQFRTQKENELKMQDYVEKDKKKEKVIEDPKNINDEINPKIIDEKDEERPHVDVN